MRIAFSIVVLSLLVLLPVNRSIASESSWAVAPDAVELLQAEIVVIRAFGERLSRVVGKLGDRTIPFFLESSGVFAAWVGIDLEEKPGKLKLAIEGWSQAEARKERHATILVKEKSFAQETLSVPADFDRFTKEVLERIRKEQSALSRIWNHATPRKFWEGRFVQPVESGITSPFGLRRIINGVARSPHSGVDLKAAEGTEIVASNHGRVVLRGDLFFSGKSLVLDHGGGLYTMYYHLSKFNVVEGAKVRKGEVIGRAGMSGRVTGPHLHWGARLNGARVDPFELMEKLTGGS